MSKLSKMKYAFSGFLVGAVFFGSVGFAATQKIEVSFDPVKFIIDNVDKTPSNNQFNNNGSKVPASIIYNGTTYVPIKMVSTMLGKPVDWDGKTKSVLVGDSVAGGEHLTHMSPLDISKNLNMNTEMTMDGQTFNNGIMIYRSIYDGSDKEHTQSYNMNGQYKSLSFMYGLTDKSHIGSSSEIVITGDGTEIWSSKVAKGVPAKDVVIDVEGVLKIEIMVKRISGNSYTAIVNPVLIK